MDLALRLPGVRLFIALWGGLALVVLSRPLPDQLPVLALLTALVARHQPVVTAATSAGIVALVDNGFVVHEYGVLAWSSATDVARSALLLCVGLLVAEVHR